MTLIPSEVISKYNEVADSLLSELGINCKLVYPELRNECDNCILDVINQTSSNVYKSGGPYPFSEGICPYCEGDGYKKVVTEEVIKLRVNWTRKNFIKFSTSVIIPDGAIQIIGYLSDLPKIRRASYIIINYEQEVNSSWAFIPGTDAVAHGFLNNRFFIATLEQSSEKL